ncbi:hypothetical protein J437_LFUL009462 [Ladona fulva]|uniref:Coiled-coil domain-containing protein 28B n=1 Tax=Ladona fulva TaxID=123851 RepID=A0A8K0PBH1_LADFU|nr:hypothetical protein J437_LFUL009462 [Ladona fulva]
MKVMGEVGGEECELQQLVPPDEVTPPVTPAITKVTHYCAPSLEHGTYHYLNSEHYMREERKCSHHSFLSDVTDVRRMETALLQLLEDFHSGKLRAFGKDCSMEQMEAIREQQERLARLHFDLGAAQELFQPLSEEGLWSGRESMQKLIKSLEKLSVCIERLHSSSASSISTNAAMPNVGDNEDFCL